MFVAAALALLLAILCQAGLFAVLAIIELGRGVKPAELNDVFVKKLVSPFVMMSTMAAGQLGMALAGIVAALLSPVPFRDRVGLTKVRPSWVVCPIAMLGSIAPLAVGLVAAETMEKIIPADPSTAEFLEALTINSAVVFVLFVGIVPGLFEEILFRGYMQQRLVQRWGAAKGIVVTSILFGFFHVTPHAISAALPLGFWFGYLAWRSESIVPAILCHFFVNSGLNAWRMIIKFGDLSGTVQNSVHLCLLAIGVICCAVCFWPRFWRERVETI